MKVYPSYKNYPKAKWRWPNFTPREMASKGDGKLAINEDAMDKLQALRDYLGKPLYITSAYRTPAYNKAVGGAKYSRHMKAIAFDVQMKNHDPAKFEAAARLVGFSRFGFYPKSDFIHIDTDVVGPGQTGEWGKRWLPKSTPLMPDMAQIPEKAPEQSWLGALLAALKGLFR